MGDGDGVRDIIRGVLMPGGSVTLPRWSFLLDQIKKTHDLYVTSSYLARFCELKCPVRRRRVLLLAERRRKKSFAAES